MTLRDDEIRQRRYRALINEAMLAGGCIAAALAFACVLVAVGWFLRAMFVE